MKVLLVNRSKKFLDDLNESIKSIDGVEIVGQLQDEDEAVKKFLAAKPDVIFLDTRLKSGNAVNILRIAKRVNPSSSFFVLIENYDPHFKKFYKELGADYFFDRNKEIKKAVKKLDKFSRKFKVRSKTGEV